MRGSRAAYTYRCGLFSVDSINAVALLQMFWSFIAQHSKSVLLQGVERYCAQCTALYDVIQTVLETTVYTLGVQLFCLSFGCCAGICQKKTNKYCRMLRKRWVIGVQVIPPAAQVTHHVDASRPCDFRHKYVCSRCWHKAVKNHDLERRLEYVPVQPPYLFWR
jgi:hypothetical protein